MIMYEVQRSRFVEMLAIEGGPVTQLELRTMPHIITSAVEDLQKKGFSISFMGDAQVTKIKLWLRVMKYDEFIKRFYDSIPISVSGMCIAAEAKKTQEDLLKPLGCTDLDF
eukprot:COSAG02_NODE_40817_length_401_cov_0.844371_1_plen_110_part_01